MHQNGRNSMWKGSGCDTHGVPLAGGQCGKGDTGVRAGRTRPSHMHTVLWPEDRMGLVWGVVWG